MLRLWLLFLKIPSAEALAAVFGAEALAAVFEDS